MAKLCKDHIIDRDSKQLDLSIWLEDMFEKHELDNKYSPKIIMGDRAFDIFKTVIQGIEQTGFGTTAYKFNGHIIPKSWITIDYCINPYYIRITWEEPIKINDGIRINGMFTDDIFTTFFGDRRTVPVIKKVIYNDPATIILWSDHTKTVVQCQEGDVYDPEKGLAMAIAKKALGNTSRKLNDVLHKWEEKDSRGPLDFPWINKKVLKTCETCKYGDQKLSKKPCKSCDASFSNWEAEE